MSTTQAQLADPAHPARRYRENTQWLSAELPIRTHPQNGARVEYSNTHAAYTSAMCDFFQGGFWNSLSYRPRTVTQPLPPVLEIYHHVQFTIDEDGYHREFLKLLKAMAEHEYHWVNTHHVRILSRVVADTTYTDWHNHTVDVISSMHLPNADWARTVLFFRLSGHLQRFMDDPFTRRMTRTLSALPASQAMPWRFGVYWFRLNPPEKQTRRVTDRHDVNSYVAWPPCFTNTWSVLETLHHTNLSLDLWRKIFGYVHDSCLRDFMRRTLQRRPQFPGVDNMRPPESTFVHMDTTDENIVYMPKFVHLTVRVETNAAVTFSVSDDDLSQYNRLPIAADGVVVNRTNNGTVVVVNTDIIPAENRSPHTFGREWGVPITVDGRINFISWTQLRWELKMVNQCQERLA